MKNTLKNLKLTALYLLTQGLNKTWPTRAGYFSSKLWFAPLPLKPSPQYKALASTSESFHVDNVQVRSWGPQDSKSTLVLVHGWGGRWDQFSTLIPRLAEQGHRVISFDLPAHGESQGFSTSILEWMPFFSKLSEKLNTKPVYICHSFGFMAVSYARKYHGLNAEAIIAINSPTSFQFLVEQYSQKLDLSSKTIKYMIQNIKQRVGSDVEERVNVQLRNLKKELPLYMIADEHDKEVPYSKHAESLDILKENFFTTQNLGHNRILQSELLANKILDILTSSTRRHESRYQERSHPQPTDHQRLYGTKYPQSH